MQRAAWASGVLLVLTAASVAAAAPAPLTWSTEPAAADLNVGDVFVLRLRGSVPATVAVNATEVAAAITTLTVAAARDRSLVRGPDKLVDVHVLARAEQRGFFALPTPRLTLRTADGTAIGSIAVASAFLAIPADAAQPELLKPNRPLQAVPLRLHPAWWAALAVLPLLAAWWWWRRRRRDAAVGIDPDALFDAELAALGDAERPLDRSTAFALSYAVRGYVERVTGVPALEQTESELSAALAVAHGLEDSTLWCTLAAEIERLEQVKFARTGSAAQRLGDRLEPVRTTVAELRRRRAARNAAADKDGAA